MKKILLSVVGLMVLAASPVFADTNTVSFEPTTYTTGNINGQDGWTKTGPFDSEVVANTYGIDGFETQSLRISNAITSGSFGDQTFAKPLVDSVGEVDATAGSFDEGTRQSRFEMQFDIASTMTEQQPGLALSVSPDRGDGSRMSYLSFTDEADGIAVTFYDVQGTDNPANFVPTVVKTGLDRAVPHTVRLVMDVVDGPSNDIVNVYIDGVLEHTGTSWENYYRFDSEASAEQSPRIVKTVLFRSSGTAVSENDGEGFLFDNVMLTSGSSDSAQPTGDITNPATDGATVSGIVNFTAVYNDGDDDNDDAVQWAVRMGTCAANSGTNVFGNVGGFNDPYNWDGASFDATADTSTWAPGEYCFVFNPTDDQGQNDVRVTRTFTVEEASMGGPTDMNQCKNGGWADFTNPSFKNQGRCVSYAVRQQVQSLRMQIRERVQEIREQYGR